MCVAETSRSTVRNHHLIVSFHSLQTSSLAENINTCRTRNIKQNVRRPPAHTFSRVLASSVARRLARRIQLRQLDSSLILLVVPEGSPLAEPD